MRRLLGTIIALSGVMFYAWHLVEKGREPHFLWVLIGATIFLIGLWFVLPTRSKKDK